MGVLVNGNWVTAKTAEDPDDTPLDNWITRDGSAGPTGRGGFPAVAGRYRLYGSQGCPFSHRALLARSVAGLDDVIALTLISEVKRNDGWEIPEGADPLFGARQLHALMAALEPGCTGRVTVPLLVDTETRRIVSTSSADVSAMFLTQFDEAAPLGTLRPDAEIEAIDALNNWIHGNINIGVYKAGLAPNQQAYEGAVTALFSAFGEMEDRLAAQRYLHGSAITESDLWFFATLIRLSHVYGPLFKCSVRQLRDYPNIWGYMLDLWSVPEIRNTVDFDRMKKHYFLSIIHTPHGNFDLNATGTVPLGPELGLDRPHDRARLS